MTKNQIFYPSNKNENMTFVKGYNRPYNGIRIYSSHSKPIVSKRI